ncbi:MAG: zinc-binding dehydrogenase [Chloroflexota bacterium]
MRTIYAETSIPRFLATRALARWWPGVRTSALGVARYAERPDPPLPTPRHVRVRNRVALICGSDMHWVVGDGDPRIGPAALPSQQKVYLGHELCGEIIEAGAEVQELAVGDRVALRAPYPTCETLGIAPACRQCAAGEYVLCENQGLGAEPPAIGGGWSDTWVAHASQLFRPPAALSDEQVALLEPSAVGVRAALQALPAPAEKVLVLGCGSTGLMIIQALHALAPEAEIIAMARYSFQAEMAARLGAQHVFVRGDGYQIAAQQTGATVYRGRMGSAMVLGGYDVVYDAVGSGRTLTDALRWARARGRVVLTGVAMKPLTVDLSSLWFQALTLSGFVWHGQEQWGGESLSTFDLAARLMAARAMDPTTLITHRYPLDRWREALRVASDRRTHGAIKVAFDMR